MSSIFDFTKGEFLFGSESGDSFMSMDGHLMSRTSDSIMMDLETGELHMTSSNGFDDFHNSWNNDDDDDW